MQKESANMLVFALIGFCFVCWFVLTTCANLLSWLFENYGREIMAWGSCCWGFIWCCVFMSGCYGIS